MKLWVLWYQCTVRGQSNNKALAKIFLDKAKAEAYCTERNAARDAIEAEMLVYKLQEIEATE